MHVAQAFYKAAETLARHEGEGEVRAGIALPDTRRHRAYVERIEPVLRQLRIAVFWVGDAEVQVAAGWEL